MQMWMKLAHGSLTDRRSNDLNEDALNGYVYISWKMIPIEALKFSSRSLFKHSDVAPKIFKRRYYTLTPIMFT